MRRSVQVGDRFGKWTVLEFSHVGKYGKLYWLCKCDCGTVKATGSILSGQSTNCGCTGRSYKHGMSKTRTFKSWDTMKQRCANPNAPDYDRYGGEGIKVCDRWLESFENFFSDMGERPEGTSLDRIDNKKGYEPDNCKWSTRSEQQRNKGNNRYFTLNNETKMLIDWAELSGLEVSLLEGRVKRGVTGTALFRPGYVVEPKPEFVKKYLGGIMPKKARG